MPPDPPDDVSSSPVSSTSDPPSWHGFSDGESTSMSSNYGKRRKVDNSYGDYVRIGADGNRTIPPTRTPDRYVQTSSHLHSLTAAALPSRRTSDNSSQPFPVRDVSPAPRSLETRNLIKETRLMVPPNKEWHLSQHHPGPAQYDLHARRSAAEPVPLTYSRHQTLDNSSESRYIRNAAPVMYPNPGHGSKSRANTDLNQRPSALTPIHNSRASAVPSYNITRSTEEIARKVRDFDDQSSDSSDENDNDTEYSSPKPKHGSIPESFADQIRNGLPSMNEISRRGEAVSQAARRGIDDGAPGVGSHVLQNDASTTRLLQGSRHLSDSPIAKNGVPGRTSTAASSKVVAITSPSAKSRTQSRTGKSSGVDKGSLNFLLNPAALSPIVLSDDEETTGQNRNETLPKSGTQTAKETFDDYSAVHRNADRQHLSMPPSKPSSYEQSASPAMGRNYLTSSNSLESRNIGRSFHDRDSTEPTTGFYRNSEDLNSFPQAIPTPTSLLSISPQLGNRKIMDSDELDEPARKRQRVTSAMVMTPEMSRSFQPPMLLPTCNDNNKQENFETFHPTQDTDTPSAISLTKEARRLSTGNDPPKSHLPEHADAAILSPNIDSSSSPKRSSQMPVVSAPHRAVKANKEEEASVDINKPHDAANSNQVQPIKPNSSIANDPIQLSSATSSSIPSSEGEDEGGAHDDDDDAEPSPPPKSISEYIKDKLYKPDPADDKPADSTDGSTARIPISLARITVKPPPLPVEQAPPPSKRPKRRYTGITSAFFPKEAKRNESDDGKKPSRRVSAGTSTVPVPSTDASKFGIIQEKLWNEPFWLLIAVKLLNKTKGSAAIPALERLRHDFPTPEALTNASPERIQDFIAHLGFQKQRTDAIIKLAQQWLESPPSRDRQTKVKQYPSLGSYSGSTDNQTYRDEDARTVAQGYLEIGHLRGCGRYAYDSWRIFCRDVLRGVADDYDGKNAASPDFEPEWKRVQPLDKELIACLKWMWLREGIIWDSANNEKRRATSEELREARERGGEVSVAQAEGETRSGSSERDRMMREDSSGRDTSNSADEMVHDKSDRDVNDAISYNTNIETDDSSEYDADSEMGDANDDTANAVTEGADDQDMNASADIVKDSIEYKTDDASDVSIEDTPNYVSDGVAENESDAVSDGLSDGHIVNESLKEARASTVDIVADSNVENESDNERGGVVQAVSDDGSGSDVEVVTDSSTDDAEDKAADDVADDTAEVVPPDDADGIVGNEHSAGVSADDKPDNTEDGIAEDKSTMEMSDDDPDDDGQDDSAESEDEPAEKLADKTADLTTDNEQDTIMLDDEDQSQQVKVLPEPANKQDVKDVISLDGTEDEAGHDGNVTVKLRSEFDGWSTDDTGDEIVVMAAAEPAKQSRTTTKHKGRKKPVHKKPVPAVPSAPVPKPSPISRSSSRRKSEDTTPRRHSKRLQNLPQ